MSSVRFAVFFIVIPAALLAQPPCTSITPSGFQGYLSTGAAQNVSWGANISPTGCSVTLDTSTTPAWMTVQNPIVNGLGTGVTVGYSISQNATSATRVGEFYLRAGSVSLRHFDIQNSTLCTFAMSPASQNFGTAGGSGSIAVTTSGATGCDWISV